MAQYGGISSSSYGFWRTVVPTPVSAKLLPRKMTRMFRKMMRSRPPPPIIVSPVEFVAWTGCCPACQNNLTEVSAVDQQLSRRQCSCGGALPRGWRKALWWFTDTVKCAPEMAIISAGKAWIRRLQRAPA